MSEVANASVTGEEEMLSVSHLTGVTPRSEKTVYMFEAESTIGYKLVEPGDLVINTMWAWMGAAGTASIDGIVSPAYGVYRIDQSIVDPRWVDYVIRTPRYVTEMTRYSRGVTSSRLRLYPDEFLRLSMPVPPLAEQRAIANYLDAETTRIDALRAKKLQLIDLLEERSASAIERLVADQTTAYTSLKRAARFFADGDWIESPYIIDEGIRLIQTGNIGRGEFRDHGQRYISSGTFETLGCTEVLPGDVLISRLANTVGQACVAPSLGGRMVTSVDVVILRPRPEFDSQFLVEWLSTPRHLERARLEARGTTMQRLARSQVGELPVPVLALEDQREIAANSADSRRGHRRTIERVAEQIDLLTEHREALIASAVMGKSQVPGSP